MAFPEPSQHGGLRLGYLGKCSERTSECPQGLVRLLVFSQPCIKSRPSMNSDLLRKIVFFFKESIYNYCSAHSYDAPFCVNCIFSSANYYNLYSLYSAMFFLIFFGNHCLFHLDRF